MLCNWVKWRQKSNWRFTTLMHHGVIKPEELYYCMMHTITITCFSWSGKFAASIQITGHRYTDTRGPRFPWTFSLAHSSETVRLLPTMFKRVVCCNVMLYTGWHLKRYWCFMLQKKILFLINLWISYKPYDKLLWWVLLHNMCKTQFRHSNNNNTGTISKLCY